MAYEAVLDVALAAAEEAGAILARHLVIDADDVMTWAGSDWEYLVLSCST